MTSFLAFGTLWFWLLLTIAVILLIIATEKNSGIGATITLVIFLVVYLSWQFSEAKVLFKWCSSHPWSVIGIIILYLLLGTAWSVWKWYFFLLREKDKFLEDRRQFRNSHRDRPKSPQVDQYRSEIIVWMSYWPFSMIWTLINDPIKRTFKWVFNQIRGSLQAMSDRVFSKIPTDMEKE